MRELCESRRYRTAILQDLEHSFVTGKNIELLIHPKDYSKAIGQKKSNLQFFTSIGYHIEIKTNETIQRNRFLLAYAGNE